MFTFWALAHIKEAVAVPLECTWHLQVDEEINTRVYKVGCVDSRMFSPMTYTAHSNGGVCDWGIRFRLIRDLIERLDKIVYELDLYYMISISLYRYC